MKIMHLSYALLELCRFSRTELQRAVLIVLLWIATSLIRPAAAQGFEPQLDEEAVQACFHAADTDETRPDCVGEAASGCMDSPGGETTIGMAECLMAETQVWDMMLNAEYGARMSEVEPNVQAALKTAQRAWIASRDADCALEYEIYAEGTIRANIYAGCMMAKTAERALMLRDMGYSEGESGQ